MINVGDRVQLNEVWGRCPKGLKVKLMATLSFPTCSVRGGITIIEVSNGGSQWKYSDKSKFEIVEQSKDLTDETLITFIPKRYLEPIDNSNIIIWNLATKWNVRHSDWYTKYRREHIEKYGYDIHKRVYKT